MSTRLTELKPCPFCGFDKIETDGTPLMVTVYCPRCDIGTAPMGDADEARRAWNTRAAIAVASAVPPTEWLALDKLNEALGLQGDATMAMLMASVRINRLQSELSAAPQPPSTARQPLADEVHSCSFFCNFPNCIKTQHDLLRDQITKAAK